VNGRAKLVGIVGTAAAVVLMAFVPVKEGGVNKGGSKPYIDPVGVRTVCYGSIRNIEDRLYTKAECEGLLAEELAEHAEGAMKCVKPPSTPGQRAAYTSLAFNIGVTAFCNSTLVRKHNAGDYWGACKEFTDAKGRDGRAVGFTMGWVRGELVQLPGLVIRRREERAMCEQDLK
jgi:lysozyme